MATVEGGMRGGIAALWGEARTLGGVLLCAVCYGAGDLIRYQFVEPEAMGAACERGHPWWCPVRTGFIMFTEWNGFGWLALALALGAAASLVRGRVAVGRRLAVTALFFGGFGMILYNASMSIPAGIIALLCLSRAR
ncbi:MAG: hypothetical protein GC201_15340 [Alphaproteobacteria bacterium]|nr:hypothetical protein [Alphaproteobacteria bacterium]